MFVKARGGGGAHRLAAAGVAVVLATVLSPVGRVSASDAVVVGARPGPSVLYEPQTRAPQLENRSPAFRAAPIRIAGAERYHDGEYLYQDYLNDDRGSDTDNDGTGAQSANVGDLTYPTDDARYGQNGADLVEFRVALRSGSLHHRFTLNTCRQPDAAIVAVLLDLDSDAATGARVVPAIPRANLPGAEEILTVWGSGGEVVRFGPSGEQVGREAVPVSVDLEACQLTVVTPAPRQEGPGARYVVATGVHKTSDHTFAVPAEAATSTTPGGARDLSQSGIFNIGPRVKEPVRDRGTPSDEVQALTLAAGNEKSFFHPLDMSALASRARIDRAPTSGTMLRIFPSRMQLGGGRSSTFPQFRQQLSEYSVRVPAGAADGELVKLTLYLHALNEYHWTNNSNPYLKWIGDDRNSLVATPLNRGPDGFYIGPAELDTFEVWQDLAKHYRIDPETVSILGTSMGGHGVYRHVSTYPDLFARAVTNVGPPGAGIWVPPFAPTGGLVTLTNLWLENVRHVPIMSQVGVADELVPYAGPRAQHLGAPELGIRGLDQLGYRFRFRTYPTAEHLVLSISSDRAVPEFLGEHRVERQPHRVTFRYAPAADHPELGLRHNHAYWISDIEARKDAPPAPGGPAMAAAAGTISAAYIDAVSHAFGRTDPTSAPTASGGVADVVPVRLTFAEVGREWSPPREAPVRNQIDLSVTGVSQVTVDAIGAGIDVDRPFTVSVTADAASTVAIATGGRRVRVTEPSVEGRGVVAQVPAGRTNLLVEPVDGSPAGETPGRGDALPATGPPEGAMPAAAALLAALGARWLLLRLGTSSRPEARRRAR